jgi:hypothetical protein
MRLDNFRYANVHVSTETLNSHPEGPFFLDDELHEITEKLMLKKPQWTLYAEYTHNKYEGNEKHRYCRRIHVYQGEEKLGSYEHDTRPRRGDHWGTENVFAVTSDRIYNQRESQRHTVKTAKQSAALKHMFTHFIPKNLEERFNGLTVNMPDTIRKVQTHKQDTVTKRCPLGINGRWIYSYLEKTNQLGKYLEFVTARSTNNPPKEGAEQRAKEAVEDFTLMDDMLGQGSGKWVNVADIVVLDGGLILSKHINNEVKAWDEYDEAIPEDLRAKLGMLKLVEPTQIVRDVGMRVSEKVFLVSRKENDNV